MSHGPEDGCDGGESRRSFLRYLGAAASTALTLPLLSGGGAAQPAPAPDEFSVSGHQIRRLEIEPEEVTVHTRKVSSDLTRRYGITPPVLTKTETFERPAPEADDLPRRDSRTIREPWNTYYAKDHEWRAVLGENTQTAGVTYTEGTYAEKQNPYGIWEYEAIDGGYEIAAPMNVISPQRLEDVVGVLDSNGWTTYVVQYNRHAWNSATGQFEQQHKSAATGTFGFLGRKHAKFWEFEGYVSCSAHIDDSVPHDAISFEDAEQAIEGVFDGASGWYGYDDYYDTNNGGQLDHDGQATGLFTY
jgi:hypothetical protein